MANERVVVELTVDAKGATTGTAEFNRAMDAANAKAEKVRENTLRMFGNVPQSADRVTQSLAKLRASLDPIAKAQLAAEQQMTRSMAVIDRAVRMGVTTQEEAAGLISRIRQKQIAEIDAVRLATQRANATPLKAANQNFNSANIAAQFQDIAVTSAMGMSPLQIALQQGTQLSAVFGQAGAAGSVAALRGAFVSLVSPVSLVTIGLTAAAAAAIGYFAEWAGSSADSEKALKEQAQLIDKVADKWGEALPALKAYNDEQQKLKDLADVSKSGEAAAQRQFDPLRESIEKIRPEVVGLIADMARLTSDDPAKASQLAKCRVASTSCSRKLRAAPQRPNDCTKSRMRSTRCSSRLASRPCTIWRQALASLPDSWTGRRGGASKLRDEATSLLQQKNWGALHPELNPGTTDREKIDARNGVLNAHAAADAAAVQQQMAHDALMEGDVPLPQARPNDIERLDMETAAAEKAAKSFAQA
jgi:hypothetical protein